ncbi:MAG TPA: hypothetical protein VNT22_09050 [Baekduia sp.]|nr:hypothetical protein [Baekduia sp.]
MSPLPQHHTRRVTLPSGKEIDVVYFDRDTAADPAPRAMSVSYSLAEPFEQLEVCERCQSHLVYPIDWSEASDTHWEVTLRCPDCEHRTVGTFSQEVVEEFDVVLDRATATLHDDLSRLTIANAEHEIERFADALADDQILPEDF